MREKDVCRFCIVISRIQDIHNLQLPTLLTTSQLSHIFAFLLGDNVILLEKMHQSFVPIMTVILTYVLLIFILVWYYLILVPHFIFFKSC